MFAEACSLVMESSDKRLSQNAHRTVVVENQIMNWSHQVHIRRHDDTGLADCSASTSEADPLPLGARRAGGARRHARMSKCEHVLNGGLFEGAASSGYYAGTWEDLDTSRDDGVISSRLKGGYGWKEVLSWAPMFDLFSKSGVSDTGRRSGAPSLASKDDFLTERDDDGGGDVNDGWVWQSRGKNGSSRKKPKPRAADVDSKSTFHAGPVGLAVEMGTEARDAVSPSRRRSETCVPSSAPARCVDSRSGIGLTSFKAGSSGKDGTTSSPTTRGHRTHGYRAHGRTVLARPGRDAPSHLEMTRKR